jgi:hypothetical protein
MKRPGYKLLGQFSGHYWGKNLCPENGNPYTVIFGQGCPINTVPGFFRAILGGWQRYAMTTPENQDEPIEVRVGSMIGTIFVIAYATFLLWGYFTTIAANFGLFE